MLLPVLVLALNLAGLGTAMLQFGIALRCQPFQPSIGCAGAAKTQPCSRADLLLHAPFLCPPAPPSPLPCPRWCRRAGALRCNAATQSAQSARSCILFHFSPMPRGGFSTPAPYVGPRRHRSRRGPPSRLRATTSAFAPAATTQNLSRISPRLTKHVMLAG